MWKRARIEAAALAAGLPLLSRPWSVDEFCGKLAKQRGRALHIHSIDLPALPFGLWFDDGERDHIICRTGFTGYYRDHVILHEVCHMLAAHNATDVPSVMKSEGMVERVIERARSSRRTNAQEELAETFASMVLKATKQASFESASQFEQRAAAMFGIS